MIVVVRNNPAKSMTPKEATCQEAPSSMFKVNEVNEKRKGIKIGNPSTTVSEADPFALKERAERKVSAVPSPMLPKNTARSSKSIEVRDQMFAPKNKEKSKMERKFKTRISNE